MTETASVDKSDITGIVQVTISAAFMQFVWLINDVALRYIDLSIILNACKEFGVEYNYYPLFAKKVAMFSANELKHCFNFPTNINVSHYIDYIKNTMPLLDPDEF